MGRWARTVACVLLALASCTGGQGGPVGAGADAPRAAAHTSAATSAAAPRTRQDPGALPGFVDKGWRISRRGPAHAIEGWADRTSVLPGEPVGLHVSTVASSWTARAYRMGWYGGVGALLVWQSDPVAGVRQPEPGVDPSTHTVQTSWPVSLPLLTADWPPGAYLIRLDSAAGQRYVPLTVRTADTSGRVVLVNDVTTWQAYNDWGGFNLYHGLQGEADFEGRSRAVSFDRPYSGDGSGDFVVQDLPAIAHAERLGLLLAYETDIDLDNVPDLLTGARAVVSLSHDEYWSTAMRDAVTQARDAGVNVAFLGANAVFRHIRFGATPTGPDRLEINYKRLSDPLYRHDNQEVTVDWREPPVPRPESTLTGVFYECNPVKADMVVTDPGNWLFAGTLATAGLRLPGLVGPEYDRVNPGAPTPETIEVLTHSPVRCRGVGSYSDSAYYTVPSGAGVFAAGSNWFTRGLPEAGAGGVVAKVVGGELTNLLQAFSAGPAGLEHPATPNLAGLHEFAGDPIALAYLGHR